MEVTLGKNQSGLLQEIEILGEREETKALYNLEYLFKLVKSVTPYSDIDYLRVCQQNASENGISDRKTSGNGQDPVLSGPQNNRLAVPETHLWWIPFSDSVRELA